MTLSTHFIYVFMAYASNDGIVFLLLGRKSSQRKSCLFLLEWTSSTIYPMPYNFDFGFEIPSSNPLSGSCFFVLHLYIIYDCVLVG